MTKGRHPVRALEAAEKIAVKRGLIQFTHRGPGRLCDFEIVSPPILVKIRIKRMRYIRCTCPWLEREAAPEIADLKMYPSSQEISRELWTCSPKYFLRYFRVTDNGLMELDRDGRPLPAKSPGVPSGKTRTTISQQAPVQPGSGSPGLVPAVDTPDKESGKP